MIEAQLPCTRVEAFLLANLFFKPLASWTERRGKKSSKMYFKKVGAWRLPLRKQSFMGSDLWSVDFDPFCVFLCFNARCFWTPEFGRVFLKSAVSFLWAWSFFLSSFLLKHGKFRFQIQKILCIKENKGRYKESTIRGHSKNLSPKWDSNPRPSTLEHRGSWLRIPSLAQIFPVSSYGWFFISPVIPFIKSRRNTHMGGWKGIGKFPSRFHRSQITNHDLLFPKRSAEMWRRKSDHSSDVDWRRRKTKNPNKTFLTSQVTCYPKQL